MLSDLQEAFGVMNGFVRVGKLPPNNLSCEKSAVQTSFTACMVAIRPLIPHIEPFFGGISLKITGSTYLVSFKCEKPAIAVVWPAFLN